MTTKSKTTARTIFTCAFFVVSVCLSGAAGDAKPTSSTRLATNATRTTVPVGELVLQLGHQRPVTSIVVSPDGKTILSVSDDGVLKQWDARDLSLVRDYTRHWGRTSQLAFSPDGQTFATFVDQLNQTCTIELWDAKSGVLRRSIDGLSYTRSLRFSPDGKRLLAMLHPDILSSWDVQSGRNLSSQQLKKDMSSESSQTSADGQTVITRSYGADSPLEVWNGASGKSRAVLQGVWGNVWRTDLSRDGKTAVSLSRTPYSLKTDSINRSVLQIWNTADGKLRRTFTVFDPELDGNMDYAAFSLSPDGNRVAVTGQFQDKNYVYQSFLKVFDTRNGQTLRDETTNYPRETLTNRTEKDDLLLSIAWMPDGQRIVGGTRGGNVAIVNLRNGTRSSTRSQRLETLDRVGFSPNGKTLIARSHIGDSVMTFSGVTTLRMWDLASGKLQTSPWGFGPLVERRPQEMFTANGTKVNATAVSPQIAANLLAWTYARDGKTIVTNAAKLWDATRNEIQKPRDVPTEEKPNYFLATRSMEFVGHQMLVVAGPDPRLPTSGIEPEPPQDSIELRDIETGATQVLVKKPTLAARFYRPTKSAFWPSSTDKFACGT